MPVADGSGLTHSRDDLVTLFISAERGDSLVGCFRGQVTRPWVASENIGPLVGRSVDRVSYSTPARMLPRNGSRYSWEYKQRYRSIASTFISVGQGDSLAGRFRGK